MFKFLYTANGIPVYYGASSDSKSPVALAGSRAIETDTGDVYTFSGRVWSKDTAAGSMTNHADGGAGVGIMAGRESVAGDLNNTNVIEILFPENLGPTLIRARLIECTNATSQCALVTNAANVAQAAGWLVAPGSLATATQRRLVMPESDNTGGVLFATDVTLPFKDPVLVIHAQMNVADPTARLILEAL